MAIYFFDSSALVKRYVSETGSKWIFSLVRPSSNNLIYVARIAGVEVTSALARRRKGNKLSPADTVKAIKRFEKHFNRRYGKVNITSDLIASAMKLADNHSLRGYDAVQLAAALEIESEIKVVGASGLLFVSADNELNIAAQNEGLAVENPNNYP
jgi:uncharacterized protein